MPGYGFAASRLHNRHNCWAAWLISHTGIYWYVVLKRQQGYLNRITAFLLILCLELEGVTSHTHLPKNGYIRSYIAQNVKQLGQIDYEYIWSRFLWFVFRTHNKSRWFFTEFTILYDQKAYWHWLLICRVCCQSLCCTNACVTVYLYGIYMQSFTPDLTLDFISTSVS